MDDLTTSPALCASPDGALPSALTPPAGAQSGREVLVVGIDADEPYNDRIPTAVRVTFGDGTTATYTAYLDTGVAVGSSGTTSLPYLSAPWPEHTTVEQDAAAELAIVRAYEDGKS